MRGRRAGEAAMATLRWPRVVRAALGALLVGVAATVYVTMREREAPPAVVTSARTDPDAVAETHGGVSRIARGAAEDFTVDYARALSYADGTLRFETVTVRVPPRNGRGFTLTGRTARVTNDQQHVAIDGDVRLTATDGLVVAADRATYEHDSGIVRVPGPVTFERGRLRGRGVGAVYDRVRDVLSLLAEAQVTVEADPATGSGALALTADRAVFARQDRYVQAEGAARVERDGAILAGDTIVARLAAGEDRIERLELRGSASLRPASAPPGGLAAMSATDMTLAYADDGHTLRQATLAGEARVELAGAAGEPGRRLAAEWADIALAADGTTVSALSARDRVELRLPGTGAGASRIVRARLLEARGEEERGLTTARFEGAVEFRETGPAAGSPSGIDRVAHAATLDAAVQPGFGALDRAVFGGGVTFRDGAMTATAPDATYDVTAGTLRLVAPPGGRGAQVVDDRATIEARTIDVTLGGGGLAADGDVRSVLRGAAPAGTRGPGAREVRRPGMLKADQPVNVTAARLRYRDDTGEATYDGGARLWQGETAVQADTIVLDDRAGGLAARGAVRSTWRLDDRDPKTGRVEKKTSVATADTLTYDDARRRATYTPGARLVGPEGDLRADTIVLVLDASGEALERLEAEGAVSLRSEGRSSTGLHLTYLAADARYVMRGAPVRVLEQRPGECRETLGRTLTFFRSTDTILVDGNEESRTQSISGGKCPGPPPS
jgi:LPS export ABC transporter protein LptC